MAKFMVKRSELNNVCKAVNDRKLAELKKEIIEILKKQDENEVKKAIDYFNSQELHYTHLEKSLISGKWIQKAGYGVGTVRIWKGKKYKKIAPGKWARVFDKEGRGTNIAIGKLIARVQKIDNVEDLMAFVMQNKQRFVDENGIDLPVLDKLRVAVDAKNNGGMGSKTTSKPAEKTDEKYDKELVDSWKDDYKDFSTDALKEKIEEYTKVLERAKNDNPSPDQRVAVKQNEHRLKALNELLEEKKNKPAEKNEDNSRYVEMAKEKIKQYAGKKINLNEISDIKILDDGERSGFLTFEFKSGNDKYKMTYDSGFGGEKGGVSIKKIESEESETENHQNRSDAMKGNKNAYKGGHEDEPVHNKVAKNGIYYTFDGFSHGLNRSFRQAKDLPQNIKDNINNSVKRYLDYVDNWADKGYKKVADDMIKNPEKYQHMSLEEFNKETGYDKSDVSEIVSLKTKIEFAEKLRNFNLEETMISKDAEQNFSRDEIYPISLKQNIEEGFLPDQIADIEREKAEKAEKKEKIAKKPSGKLATSNPDKLKPIAKAEKIADGKVKMPYSKELSDEIKQLVGTLDSKKKNLHPREFFTKVYYDNGNLIATDSHALKIVKVGELDGIPNGSYVDIENTKDGVTLTRDKEFSENYKFANYNRIIPDNNKEKIVLDNKALLSKVKELKKDGGIVGKDSYVTFDIKGNDLMLDGVKVGDVSAANFEGEGSDYFNMDVNLLTPYLSGDTTDLISSTDNEKAMYIGNDSAINIIMPQNKWDRKVDSNGNWVKEERRKNYENQRAAKAYEEETKANQKAAKKQSNQEYVEYMINRVKESVNKPDFAERMIAKLPNWTTEQLQRLHKQAIADVDHLMETKDFNANSFMTFTDKNFGVMPRVFIGQNYAMKQHPEIVKEVERLLEERGAKIEKSLFDGFLGLELLEEDIDDMEEEKEEESLWNDYSAEQPELFNSVELQVTEAMNRHYSNCL